MGHVQDLFFKTFTLATEFTLLIEPLCDARLRVDPVEHASRPVNWRGPATCASIQVRDNTRAGGPFSAGRGHLGISHYNYLSAITPLFHLCVPSDLECFHRVMEPIDRLPYTGDKVVTHRICSSGTSSSSACC
jgi:hypothetical protein